jgi:hypothetical protein
MGKTTDTPDRDAPASADGEAASPFDILFSPPATKVDGAALPPLNALTMASGPVLPGFLRRLTNRLPEKTPLP